MRSSKDTDTGKFLRNGQHIAGEVMEKVAASVPKMYVNSLLPFLNDVLAIVAYRSMDSPLQDPIWASGFRVRGKFAVRRGLDDGFMLAMKASLRWLAVNEPEEFRAYAKGFEISKYAAVQNLLMCAYEADGRLYADEAVQYLLADLRTRDSASCVSATSEGVVESLIKSVTPHCSHESLTELEKAILEHYPDNERGFENRCWWGNRQFRLLKYVDGSRISEKARRRLQELRRKFGEVALSTPSSVTSGTVRSPIPRVAIQQMTDDNWLSAMKSYSSDRRSYTHDDWLKGGASQLSTELETQVKEDPARFARLIQKMPDDANSRYFEAILRGIVDSGLDMDATVAACLRCHNVPGYPFGRDITQPLTQFQEEMLPDEALRMIRWYAAEDADPEPTDASSTRTYQINGQKQNRYEPLTAGINSVRGIAVLTVAKLVFQSERNLSYFKPHLKRMVNDPSDAVRACVAEVLVASLQYDCDLAVDLFLELSDSDERLLATHYFDRFLHYAIHTHFKELQPTLSRMVESKFEDVATAGSRRACVASLSVDEAIPLARRCISGPESMRKAAAEVYARNIRYSACRAECEKMLGILFSDDDKDVRETASRCFIGFEGSELRDYSDLVKSYIESPAFEPDSPLIRALRDTTANMPSEILLACERYFDLVGGNAGDVSARASANSEAVITLVIRVYGKATTDEVKSKCLDLIDKAILLGAYGVDSVEDTFDR